MACVSIFNVDTRALILYNNFKRTKALRLNEVNMNPITAVMNQEPFLGKLIIGNFLESTISAIKEFFSEPNIFESSPEKSVAIVAKEKDYLLFGKSIKDGLTENGFNVEPFVTAEFTEKFIGILKNFPIVVTVGDDGYISQTAIISKKENLHVIAVNSTLIFASNFSKKFPRLDALCLAEGAIYKYVLDLEYCKKLKRSDLADAYSYIASLSLGGLFVEIDDTLNKTLTENEKSACLAETERAYKTLLFMNDVNIVGVITASQFYVARAVNVIFKNDLPDVFLAGEVLSKMTSAPKYECVFGLIGAYLTLIKGYLSLDKTIFCLPEVNKDVTKLAEVLKINELSIYERFDLLPNGKIKKSKQDLLTKPELNDKIDGYLKRYKKLQTAYENVYRGRKNRKSYTITEEIEALKLAGLLSKGFLGLAYSDGYFELLN